MPRDIRRSHKPNRRLPSRRMPLPNKPGMPARGRSSSHLPAHYRKQTGKRCCWLHVCNSAINIHVSRQATSRTYWNVTANPPQLNSSTSLSALRNILPEGKSRRRKGKRKQWKKEYHQQLQRLPPCRKKPQHRSLLMQIQFPKAVFCRRRRNPCPSPFRTPLRRFPQPQALQIPRMLQITSRLLLMRRMRSRHVPPKTPQALLCVLCCKPTAINMRNWPERPGNLARSANVTSSWLNFVPLSETSLPDCGGGCSGTIRLRRRKSANAFRLPAGHLKTRNASAGWKTSYAICPRISFGTGWA